MLRLHIWNSFFIRFPSSLHFISEFIHLFSMVLFALLHHFIKIMPLIFKFLFKLLLSPFRLPIELVGEFFKLPIPLFYLILEPFIHCIHFFFGWYFSELWIEHSNALPQAVCNILKHIDVESNFWVQGSAKFHLFHIIKNCCENCLI